jgi:hypothetical protein
MLLSAATAHEVLQSHQHACCMLLPLLSKQMYPDAAHKAEMVVSLSGFCGFAGFLSPDDMAQLLQDYPQFNELLGADNVMQFLDAHSKQDDKARQLVGVWMDGAAGPGLLAAAVAARCLLKTVHNALLLFGGSDAALCMCRHMRMLKHAGPGCHVGPPAAAHACRDRFHCVQQRHDPDAGRCVSSHGVTLVLLLHSDTAPSP